VVQRVGAIVGEVRNPILRGHHPDPSIVRVGDTFHLVTSSNEYSPGLPVYTSTDLAEWTPAGAVLAADELLPLDGAPSSLGIFAPTIRHDGARFAVTSTLVGTGHFLTYADEIAGPWSTPIFLEGDGWDPSLVFEDDRAWLTWSTGHAIRCREIEPGTGATIGDEHELWRGTGGDAPEGPHLYHVGSWWYLVIAEGGTGLGHAITVARSRELTGPYEPHPGNPVLTHRGLGVDVQAIGHADLVQAGDGTWWAVLLGVRLSGGPGYQLLGRETFLVPVRWRDGWPELGVDGRVPDVVRLPWAVGEGSPSTFRDALGERFTHDVDPGWRTLREPAPPWLSASDSGLALHGTPATLDDVAPVAFIGRRQEEHAWVVSATLAPAPQGAAGLAVRRDERHHYELVVIDREGPYAVVRARIGDLRQEFGGIRLPAGPVRLEVACVANAERDPVGSPGVYRFAAGAVGEDPDVVAELDARYLSTEVAGGFTGVVIGMYATGDGIAAGGPAVFSDWSSGPDPRGTASAPNPHLRVGV
jgi:xylan 1,4-beta-xylosidase